MKLRKENTATIIAFILLFVSILFYFLPNVLVDSDETSYAKLKGIFNEELSALENYAETQKNILSGIKLNSLSADLAFFEKLNNSANKYFVSVYDSSAELIAWNKAFRKINEAKLVKDVALNTPYLERDNLFEIISVVKKFSVSRKQFFLKTSFVVKKYFSLHNDYEEKKDFVEKIAEENFQLLDGKRGLNDAFPLKLNGEIIGYVTRENYGTRNSAFYLLSLISVFFSFLFFAYSLRTKKNKLAYVFFAVAFYRALLFLLFGDYRNSGWDVANPQYFSSAFGLGLFASPLALFFSVALIFYLLAAALIILINKKNFRTDDKATYLLPALGLILFPFVLRAFGATVRSLIFDSDLNLLTKSFDILNPLSLFYLLSVFLIALAFLVLETLLILFVLKRTGKKIAAFALFLFAAIIFHALSPSPQSPLMFKIAFIAAVFFLSAYPFSNKKRFALFSGLTAAISVVLLLFYHNSDYEKSLFKYAAWKIAKPDRYHYQKLITNETTNIAVALQDENIRLFNNSLAYRYWNSSRLPFEAFSSAIEITDSSGETVYFYYNKKEDEIRKKAPFVARAHRKIPKGYDIFGSVDFSPTKLFNSTLPEFFIANNQALVSLKRRLNLGLLIFRDGKLVFNSIPATLTKAKKRELLTLTKRNGKKISVTKINRKEYDLLAIGNRGRKTVYFFLKPAPPFAYKFFEALKLFGAFFLFILIPLLLLALPDFLKRKKRLTFRTTIFVGVALVSVIPLILLAVYFRNLSEEKNLNSRLFKLNKKALAVGKYLRYSEQTEDDPVALFERARDELKFDFTVFYKDKIFYTTHPLYFENGILPDVLNPEAVVNIELERINDILLTENIEKYARSVFYSKIFYGGESYIIQIDEAFNPIILPMSERELDVMLVTSYSVAALGIILLGFLLAYYLSRPINELTEATRKIAEGDLDLQIKTKAFGEVKELVDGFNFMARELKITQQKLIASEREAAWREMARQVAHEIKNPLTPMKLSIQQLIAMKKENDENFDEAFFKITDSTLSQIELLKNIASEFSTLGKMPGIKPRELNLLELLKKVKSLFSNEDVEITLDSSLEGITLFSDEEYLTRIFVNILRNAKEANANKIEIYAETNDAFVSVYVKNNGEKIPKEIQDKIFGKNFTTKQKGNGLGLFLATEFLRKNGGDIVLEKSDENKTVFKLIFPIDNSKENLTV